MRHEKAYVHLLNMEKTWKHLSNKQREWLCDQFRLEYVTFLNKNGEHPRYEGCQEIVGIVYERMGERDIWLPYGELKKAFSAKLPKYRKININM